MSTYDAQGNKHANAGKPGGGRFETQARAEMHTALGDDDLVGFTTVNGRLVPGEHVTGTSVGFIAGKVDHTAIWSGTYVGIQEPDPDDPWLDENGYPTEDQGGATHLFRDGEVNGVPQNFFAFPVSGVHEDPAG